MSQLTQRLCYIFDLEDEVQSLVVVATFEVI